MFRGSKSIKIILYSNIVLFILSSVFSVLYNYLSMFPMSTDMFHYYQLITYQFMHAGFLHILFNMFMFLTFSPDIEDRYGTKKFIIYYLLCGIGAALLNNILSNSSNPLVGASGSIFGMMTMFTLLYPNQKFYIFFIPIGIKCKWIISFMLIFEVIQSMSSNDNVSHFGHIGGAITRIILYLQNKYKIFSLNES